MRILMSVIIIVGACIVVMIGLLSVVHDLLIRTTTHTPLETDRRDMGREVSASRRDVSNN